MRQPEHWGHGIVKTQGMIRAEVEAALARAGLEVPERERAEIAAAAHFIEEMAQRMRCPLGTVMSRLHRGRMLLRRALTHRDRAPDVRVARPRQSGQPLPAVA